VTENSDIEPDFEIDQVVSLSSLPTGNTSTADSSLTGSSTTPDFQVNSKPKVFNKLQNEWRSMQGIVFTKHAISPILSNITYSYDLH
jgi:hypothetical protein